MSFDLSTVSIKDTVIDDMNISALGMYIQEHYMSYVKSEREKYQIPYFLDLDIKENVITLYLTQFYKLFNACFYKDGISPEIINKFRFNLLFSQEEAYYNPTVRLLNSTDIFCKQAYASDGQYYIQFDVPKIKWYIKNMVSHINDMDATYKSPMGCHVSIYDLMYIITVTSFCASCVFSSITSLADTNMHILTPVNDLIDIVQYCIDYLPGKYGIDVATLLLILSILYQDTTCTKKQRHEYNKIFKQLNKFIPTPLTTLYLEKDKSQLYLEKIKEIINQ